MKPRNLALAAAATISLASGALAQEWQNTTPLKVESGDTLSEIAHNTWTTVSKLMTLNPEITDRFWTVCAWVRPWKFFCTAPEHTIFPGDEIQTQESSTEDASIKELIDNAWLEDPETAERIISEGISKIPWLTPENALSVIVELERIPVTANIGIALDMSGSTSEDRVMIASFVKFIIEDRQLAAQALTDGKTIGNTTLYGYTSVTQEIEKDQDLTYMNIWEGSTENTIWAISTAYKGGADYVIVITDEPWDDSWEVLNKENTSIFMIQDWESCWDDCWDNHPYGGTPLNQHGKVVYITPSS